MKTKITLLMCLVLSCCLEINKSIAQTAYAVDMSTYNIVGFNLSSPGTSNSISTLPTDYYIAAGAWANETWYVGEFNNMELAIIDRNTGAYSSVGYSGVYFIDLAYDITTSTMYATAWPDDFSDVLLYTVNLSNGSVSAIGSLGTDWPAAFPAGLACSPSGQLYITNGEDKLYSANKTDATFTLIGSLGVNLSDMVNLEYDLPNNKLYLSGSIDGGSSGSLHLVNPATGSATLVGSYPAGFAYVYGLAIPNVSVITNDIAIQSFIAPVSGYGLSTTEPVTIRVVNEGAASQLNIPVSYTINGGLPVNETIAGPIANGAQFDYTFTQTANLSSIQAYTLVAKATLPGDEVSFNNSATADVTNLGYTHDLAALSVNGSTSPYAGIPTEYTVFVKNKGGYTENGANYSVVLYNSSNEVISSQSGVDIESQEVKSFNFSKTFTSSGSTHMYAKVILSGDLNPANDQTANLSIYVLEESQIVADVWISTGPDGVNLIKCIGGDKNHLFIGTSSGLYRSVNEGDFWEFSGLIKKNVNAVYKHNGYVFAATTTGVFRSDDNGATWVSKSTGLPTSTCQSLAAIGENIFVGLNTSSSGNSGIYRSSNNGETWVLTNVSTSDFITNNLLAVGSTLFAASPFSGILRSTDLGNNWTEVNTGMEEFSNVYSMASSGSTIFAGTNGALFRSTNNGNSWIEVQEGYFYALSATETHIYAGRFPGSNGGVIVSNDDGLTWSEKSSGLPELAIVELLAYDARVFCADIQTLSRSTEFENKWEGANNGLRQLNISNLLRCDNRVYASSGNGVYSRVRYSTNDGGSWASFELYGQQVKVVKEINTNVWAAKAEDTDRTNVNYYITYNGGETWNNTPAPLTNEESFFSVGCLGTTLFASILQPDYSTIQARSTNNGVTWEQIPLGIVNGWKTIGSVIYASAGNSRTLYRSTDNGVTWEIPTGLSEVVIPKFDITSNGTDLYLGIGNNPSGAGVYKSTDNGESWIIVHSTMAISKFFVNGADLYAFNNASVYYSANSGSSWSDIGANLGGINRESFRVYNNMLFVSKSNNGVYCSTNKGTTWFAINNGFNPEYLPDSYRYIVIGQEHILIGTSAQSVWRLKLSTLAAPEQPSDIQGLFNPCVNSTQTYSVDNVVGVTYNWQLPTGWVINSGSGTNSIEVTVGSNNGIILVSATNDFGISPIQAAFVVPTSLVTPLLSIGTDNLSVCEGTEVTITATPVNGGTSPSYQWFVNSQSVGANSPVLTYTPQTGDVVNAILTSNAECANPATANSNTLGLTVEALPDVTWSAFEPTNFCIDGEPVTLSGGLPEGGTYSGAGVTGNVFNPVAAGLGDHTITYTYASGLGCTNEATLTLIVNSCTGVNTSNINNIITLYPNPASETVNIVLNGQVARSVRVVSLLGVTVVDLHNLPQTNAISLPVSSLAKGTYLVQVDLTNGGRATKQLVIK